MLIMHIRLFYITNVQEKSIHIRRCPDIYTQANTQKLTPKTNTHYITPSREGGRVGRGDVATY